MIPEHYSRDIAQRCHSLIRHLLPMIDQIARNPKQAAPTTQGDTQKSPSELPAPPADRPRAGG
jgi:hypothetical protein